MCIVILFYSLMYSVVSYRWRHARSQTSFWLYDHLCPSKCFLQHSNVASLYKKLMTLNTKFIANHFNDFGGPWAIESDLLCSVCLRLCPRNNFKVRSDLWLNSWNADILRFKFVGPGHRSKFKATWQNFSFFRLWMHNTQWSIHSESSEGRIKRANRRCTIYNLHA